DRAPASAVLRYVRLPACNGGGWGRGSDHHAALPDAGRPSPAGALGTAVAKPRLFPRVDTGYAPRRIRYAWPPNRRSRARNAGEPHAAADRGTDTLARSDRRRHDLAAAAA